MIIVSDTSAISALLSLAEARLLRELFGEVVVPDAVHAELLRHHPGLPEFVQVVSVRDETAVDALLNQLDPGEAAAIVVAKELNADLLLIDEKRGRRFATAQGLKIVGLVGVVLLAKQRGLLPSVRIFIERLQNEAGFHLSKEVKGAAIQLAGEAA